MKTVLFFHSRTLSYNPLIKDNKAHYHQETWYIFWNGLIISLVEGARLEILKIHYTNKERGDNHKLIISNGIHKVTTG